MNTHRSLHSSGSFRVAGSWLRLLTILLWSVGLITSLRAAPPAGFGGYIAVGSNGTLLTSLDGATWSARTSGTAVRLRAAAYKPGTAVVVGEAGTVLTSPDGVTWTSVASGITEGLRGVASNGASFIAVGGQTAGRVFSSADGTTWSEVTLGFAAGKLRGVVFNGSQFVAVGAGGTILTSADGAAWTDRSSAGMVERIDGVLWTGTYFYILTETGKLMRSSDAVSWSAPSDSNAPAWAEGMAWSSGRVVFVGAAGRIRTSDDGSTFTWRSSGLPSTVTLHGVMFAGAFAPQVIDPATLFSSLRSLTVSGITASNKEYDGSTSATLNTASAALVGVFAGDSVTLNTGSAAGAFGSASVGSGKSVAVSGLTLSGADAGNYTLTQPTATADITAKAVTVTGVTASNKIYDGGVTATPSFASAALSGVLVADVANVNLSSGSASAVFSSKTVGSSKTVTVSGLTLTGTAASNYSLTQPTTTANITVKSLTVTGTTATNKVYDGNTTASPVFTSSALSGVVAGDTVTLVTGSGSGTFGDKTVATNKTVTIAGLTITGGDAGNYSLTQPTATANITAKSLTVTGTTASNKVYDGNTTATPSFGSAALSGVIAGDTVTLVTGSGSGTFGDKTVATNKTVTIAGLTITGGDAGNYSLTQPTTTANITAKSLTVTGTTATNKVYDGNTTASPVFTSSALSGVVAGDTVTLVTASGSGTFADKTVATNKTVTVAGLTLSGGDAGNYSLTQPTTTANITAKTLTVTGVTASNKVYDRGTTATPSFGAAALSGVVAGDTVTLVTASGSGTFADKTVATNKTVTIAGLTITGGDAGNYSLTQPTTTANITAKSLTVTGTTASNKVYDGNTTATPSFGSSALSGVIAGDTVTLVTASGTATFSDKTVAANKTVTVAGLTLSGADSANYSLTQPTTTATITAKGLTVSGTVVNTRAYDGTVIAPLNFAGASLVGVVAGDVVTLVSGAASATYADANAAAGKSVTVVGVTLSGADSGNYSLSQPSGVTGTISPALVGVVAAPWLRVYDGQPKPVTVTLSGANVPYTVVYDGKTTPPTNAGSYVVRVTLNDANYSGGADGTLIIQPATQTISIKAPTTGQVGTTANVSATANSELPVTLSVVSGGASLTNGVLSFNTQGTVTLRATQAGTQNYAAATAEATITVAGKKAQTITFPSIADRLSNSGAITLAATATSGLPVTFAVQSGPALLSGNVLTLTGSAGRVVLVASQAGDAVWNAAPDVSVGFTVTAAGMNVYFGSVNTPSGSGGKVGDIAAAVPPNSNSGSLVVVAPSLNLSRAVDFTFGSDGRFTQTIVIDVPSGPAADGEPSRAAAPVTVTIRGQLIGGRLSGTIDPLGVSFDAPVLPVTGASANSAGFYKASSIGTTTGTTYSVVGTNNEVLALSTSGSVTVGGVTKLAADGTFALQTTTTQGTVTLKGSVDEPTATVAGSLTVGNQVTSFAGVSAVVTRTDRMINLSSRVRLNGSSAVLITGFVIGGTETKQVAIRGVGPTLSSYGVTGAMADPVLRVYSGSTLVAENDNWSAADAATFARLGAFALPAGSKDAAVVLTLKPGAYTAQVSGAAAGVALAEIYDASTNPSADYQRLVNISSRGEVTAGDGVLIGGFVVTGNSPKQLLIRGIGPSLGAFGVPGVLADPRLRVYRDSAVLAENDNWSVIPADATSIADAARRVGAFALQSGSKDAAVIVTLSPGAYTAQVISNDGTPGTALIEIYELP